MATPVRTPDAPPRLSRSELRAETEPGHSWLCSMCRFRTDLVADAVDHCRTSEWADTGCYHQLHELAPGWTTRVEARRHVYRFDREQVKVGQPRPRARIIR